MSNSTRRSLAELSETLAFVLSAAGASRANAAVVADHLVEAQAMGHASHGVRLVDVYVGRLRDGKVSGTATPIVTTDSGCLLRIDGNGAFGQVAGAFASARGVERAKSHGLCMVSVGNARHFGRNGRWPENAARGGVASIHFVHGFSQERSVVPYGSTDRRLGTTPIAIGCPSPDGGVIIDFSVAETSANTVRHLHELGEQLPFPALMGRDGLPTDDPATFVEGTAGLMPFGGFKGYGLGVLAQMFAAGIGAGGCFENGSNAMFSIYLDVEQLVEPEIYSAYVERLIDDLRTAAPLPGGAGVAVPGDRGRAALRRGSAEGIVLQPADRGAIFDAAVKAGVADQLATRWPDSFERPR